MAFQFLCPQGHLLQGDESLAGQQCQCPYCHSLFLVPQPQMPAYTPAPAPSEPSPPAFQAPPVWDPAASAPADTPPQQGFPNVQLGPQFGANGAPAIEQVDPMSLPGGSKQFIVHVVCPSGHELETPRDMLGQDALCPFCQVQFRLKYEHTLEYRQEKAEEIERKERKAAQLWLNWAIGIGIVVVLGVITLFAIAASW